MPTIAPAQAALKPSDQKGLPLGGRSILVIEDEALIAMSVESCLLDAGATIVKIANSIAAAQSALDEGIPFDAAIVDLLLTHENAWPLIQILSERRIPILITTGADIDLGHPALSNAVAFLQKPYNDSDLIEALVEWAMPDIATGNIGRIAQIASGTSIPVLHTIELLDFAHGGPKPDGLESAKGSPRDRAPLALLCPIGNKFEREGTCIGSMTGCSIQAPRRACW
jgi:CheY-like chemotaxis protein